MTRAIASLALLLATGAQAASAPELRFVSCPVYRNVDAGKKSGCWLTENPASGIRYDVSTSPTKPDWNHAILVEGRAAAVQQTEACGGVVLDPVRVSILPQGCTRTMLPAEGYKGRKFALPRRNVRPLYKERQRPATPFGPRTFVIPFDYGSDFVTYQLSDYYIDQATNYALDVQPARVNVIGHVASRADVVSSVRLQEPSTLADARAKKIAEWMRLRGVPANRLHVSATHADTSSDDQAFDDLVQASRRRVVVQVVPIEPGLHTPELP